MSDSEFENYIALIGKLLQLNRNQGDQIASELQDHLDMRISDLETSGVDRQQAIKQALEEFGDAAVMAKNFNKVTLHKRKRWMMRFVTFSIAGSFAAVVLMMAMWPDNARFGAPGQAIAQQTDEQKSEIESDKPARQFSSSTQLNRKTEQTLKERTDLAYDQTPFREVLEDLESRTGLKFLLHRSAMEDSLTEDNPFTFNLACTPLNRGLMMMLEKDNATYVINDGVVVIISIDEEMDFLRIKAYDCRELLASLPKSTGRFTIRNVFGGGGGFGGGGFGGAVDGYGGGGYGGGGVVSIPPTQFQEDGSGTSPPTTSGRSAEIALLDQKLKQILEAVKAQEEKVDDDYLSEGDASVLIETIMNSVAPDSWRDSGSGVGTISTINGILLISQSEKSHLQIDRLLTDLEAMLIR